MLEVSRLFYFVFSVDTSFYISVQLCFDFLIDRIEIFGFYKKEANVNLKCKHHQNNDKECLKLFLKNRQARKMLKILEESK